MLFCTNIQQIKTHAYVGLDFIYVLIIATKFAFQEVITASIYRCRKLKYSTPSSWSNPLYGDSYQMTW